MLGSLSFAPDPRWDPTAGAAIFNVRYPSHQTREEIQLGVTAIFNVRYPERMVISLSVGPYLQAYLQRGIPQRGWFKSPSVGSYLQVTTIFNVRYPERMIEISIRGVFLTCRHILHADASTEKVYRFKPTAGHADLTALQSVATAFAAGQISSRQMGQ
jgi:hypothetical protein